MKDFSKISDNKDIVNKEYIDSSVVPIERGGTNATDRKTAIANLMVLPRNTVPVEDTPAAWAALGNCIIFYDLNSTVINKPSNYGTLIQTVSTGTATSVEQVWQRQAYGHQYYRGGNTAGWYGDANLNGIDAWHAVLDDRGGVLENPLWLRTTGIGTDDTAKLGQIQTAEGARKAFSNAAAERVGYLTITLPNGYNGGILAFDVEITDYSNSVVTYTINSQLYANSSGAHSWANGVAICSGALNSKISNLPVHMGDNGDKCQIQIGNADTQWGIGIVIIKNIRSYYNHYGASNWLNGWDISVTPTPITTVERTKDSANIAPVKAGGTGANTAKKALENLQGISKLATYYGPSAVNGIIDTMTDSIALVALSKDINSELYNILGDSFAYVSQFFFSEISSTSARMQIAHAYQKNTMATRIYKSSTGWTTWRTIDTDDYVSIPQDADLNTYTHPGIFACMSNTIAASLKNSPIQNYFLMKVTTFGNYMLQEIKDVYTGRKYYRYYNSVQSTFSAWHSDIQNTDIMTGATASAAGTSGLVPIPLAGTQEKFLKGDGTWRALSATDITSGTLPISRGGTGATTAADARTKLGITPENIGAISTTKASTMSSNGGFIYFKLDETPININIDDGTTVTYTSLNPGYIDISTESNSLIHIGETLDIDDPSTLVNWKNTLGIKDIQIIPQTTYDNLGTGIKANTIYMTYEGNPDITIPDGPEL